MDKSIEAIKDEALKAIESAEDRLAVEAVSTRYIGRKGVITQFLRNISNLPIRFSSFMPTKSSIPPVIANKSVLRNISICTRFMSNKTPY